LLKYIHNRYVSPVFLIQPWSVNRVLFISITKIYRNNILIIVILQSAVKNLQPAALLAHKKAYFHLLTGNTPYGYVQAFFQHGVEHLSFADHTAIPVILINQQHQMEAFGDK
jgi:hypothetical protein